MMATRSRKRKRLALEHYVEARCNTKRASVAGSCFSVCIDRDSLEEILSKLPVKSLIRFRCVPQEWYALTQNPSFITKQHLSCSHPNMYLFIDRYPPAIVDDGEFENKYGVFEFSMLDSKSKVTRLDLSFVNKLKSIRYVASSNGLICLFAHYEFENGSANDDHQSIIVCNPSTKQFRYLPIPNPFKNWRKWPLLGFEFSLDIREYKLVSIFPEPVRKEELEVTSRVQVLTQSSNSWRRLNHELKFPSCKDDCFTDSSLTCNGVLYWIVKKTHTDNFFVLSFNLRNEAFMHVISMPPTIPGALAEHLSTMPVAFSEWKNLPAILLPSPDGRYHVLWVMKTTKISMPPSWTRQIRFRDNSFPKGLVKGFWNDQFLMTTAPFPKGDCVWYEPASKKTRMFRKQEGTKEYWQVVKFVQSLLLVF